MHKCYAHPCKRLIPDHLLMCKSDWAMVSPQTQREVYAAYRLKSNQYNQESAMAHYNACQKARNEVAAKKAAQK